MRRLTFTLAWVAVLTLALTALAPGLTGGFFFDDSPNIVENTAIHITSVSLDTLAASLEGPRAGPLGRPVSVLSFALTHAYFGLDAYAFKAINLAIHCANALLVAWLTALLMRLTPQNTSKATRMWLPIWVAAIWIVHPIHFVAVMMAAQRMTLLAGLFTLLALIAHLKGLLARGRTHTWLYLIMAWLVLWPLSILSKETGLMFPMYVLAITLFVIPPSRGAARGIGLAASAVALGIAGIGMVLFLGTSWMDHAYAMRPFTLTERVMTEARVLWFYLGQVLLPSYGSFGLYLDWLPHSTGLLSPPSTIIALLAWCIAIILAIALRHRIPLLGFGVFWFLLGHSLESSFLPLEIAHEHRNYLPALGPIFVVGYSGGYLLNRMKLDHPRATVIAAAVTPILFLGFMSWLRAEQMSRPLIGTQIEASRHPMSARANHAAGVALMVAGFGDAGDPLGGKTIRYYFEQAERADPSFKWGYHGLLVWACASGRPIEPAWLDAFADRLNNTPFQPGQVSLPGHLLRALTTMPHCLPRSEALRLFSAGGTNWRISPALRAQFLEAASDYELVVSRDPDAAQTYLEQALKAWPHDARLKDKLSGYTSRHTLNQ